MKKNSSRYSHTLRPTRVEESDYIFIQAFMKKNDISYSEAIRTIIFTFRKDQNNGTSDVLLFNQMEKLLQDWKNNSNNKQY